MISRFLESAAKRRGLPPGSVVLTKGEKYLQSKIRVINFSEDFYEDKFVDKIEEAFERPQKATVSWINIDGLANTDIITKIGEKYNLHPLILEDVVSIGLRPKVEEYDDYLFIIVRMVSFDKNEFVINAEQISMVIMKDTLITFQETHGDVFDIIRDRIKAAKGRVRKMGPDYLGYCLIDALVDSYFVILDAIGEEIEAVEDNLDNILPDRETLMNIHELKRETIFLRRSVWPLREILSVLQRTDSMLINDASTIYFKDSYDHTLQVLETIDSYREMLSSMHEVYLSCISTRLNEIMKVLTIISTIFIPLNFIASIYGMNFNTEVSKLNMPELNWKYGYVFTLFVMACVAAGMLFFFKKRKWI